MGKRQADRFDKWWCDIGRKDGGVTRRVAKAIWETAITEQCVLCGAELLPLDSPPHCEDCIVTE